MNAIATNLSNLVDDYAEIANCEDQTWITNQLATAVDLTIKHVARIAALLRRAEELGIEVDISVGPVNFLRRIAYDQMLPELYIAFEDEPQLLNRLGQLPLPDQKKIASGKPLKVCLLDADDKITNVMLPVREMTQAQVRQVISKGRIHSESEQLNRLRDRIQISSSAKKQSPYTVDSKRGTVTFQANASLTSDDLLRIMAELGRKKRK